MKTLKDFADKIYHDFCRMTQIIVLYSEVFGGNVTGSSKNYTSRKEFSFRIFDIAIINDYEKFLEMSREEIASWRDRGGQTYLSVEEFTQFCDVYNFPKVPYIGIHASNAFPSSIDDTYKFLKNKIAKSQAILDNEASGLPEGIVIRNENRSKIAKIRYEDYERTIKKRKQNA